MKENEYNKITFQFITISKWKTKQEKMVSVSKLITKSFQRLLTIIYQDSCIPIHHFILEIILNLLTYYYSIKLFLESFKTN